MDRQTLKLISDYEALVPKERSALEPVDPGAQWSNEIPKVCGIDNLNGIIDLIPSDYEELALMLRKQLWAEFKCQESYKKKLLADSVLVNYINLRRRTEELNHFMEQSLVPATLRVISLWSREVDRLDRRMQSALQKLINLEQPLPNIQVKAAVAFLAQNQQINAQPTYANSIDRQ